MFNYLTLIYQFSDLIYCIFRCVSSLAETVLSSSVDCISLAQTDASADREAIAEAIVMASNYPDANDCAIPTLNVSIVAEEHGDRTCSASLSVRPAESGGMLSFVSPVDQNTTDIEGTEASINRTENEDFDEDTTWLATFSNATAEPFTASAETAPGPWSPISQGNKNAIWSRHDAENSMAAVPPGFSAGETFFQKYESENSSEGDEDNSLEDKYSDSSSSPSSCYRGRGSTTRRDGPRRQQGRGQVKPIEEERLYDRLPSYYTVLSRPNRTPSGLIRSSRSCFKLILNADLPSRDRDPSPDNEGEIFDKVPAYQSCFTNSTRYDEDSEICMKVESGGAYVGSEEPRSGRGHGSGSSYVHTRPRFRSRSRLRSATSTRHKRSGQTVVQKHTSSIITLEKITASETRLDCNWIDILLEEQSS